MITFEAAVEGKRYLVEWEDCCVEGSFEAVLERKNYGRNNTPDNHSLYLDSLTFANGVTIDGHGVSLTEIDDPST